MTLRHGPLEPRYAGGADLPLFPAGAGAGALAAHPGVRRTALRSCRYSGNLSGVLIAVDAKAAKESLVTVCSTLGMRLDTSIVREKMTARNGCMALCGTPWTQSFFETVRYLSEQEQERYCVFKSVELLYLLCTTRMPIQQIAQAVGYEGMSQFNAAFKRAYGMTPGQYRKISETATLRPF